jgi:hypothetical protein
MNSLSCQSQSVKSSRAPLADNEERVVSLPDAIALVKQARQAAFSCKLNEVNFAIIDVSKACALRHLRRLKGRVRHLQIADIFGTTVIG